MAEINSNCFSLNFSPQHRAVRSSGFKSMDGLANSEQREEEISHGRLTSDNFERK